MRELKTWRMARHLREYRQAKEYTEAVKRPLSEAEIEALCAALKSGDVPRYRRARKSPRPGDEG